jgi:DNA topoisomerase II
MSLGEKYKKENLQNHIYNTPDTYVGGCDLISEKLCIYDPLQDKIVEKEIEYIPALYNIYNEILVNSKDQVTRLNGLYKDDKSVNLVTEIKVNFDIEKGEISIMNNGDGIDVAEHPKEKKNGKAIYIPQLIFGELLTSTNYNKDEQKIVGGKNGYGAKLTNIFSKSFKLETVDSIRKKKYTQLFRGNMKIIQKPKISDYSGKPYTKITWVADFKRFGIENYSEDMLNLMIRRVYDISGITDKNVSVYLNKKKLSIKGFCDYSKMYLSDEILIYDEFIDNNIPWKIGVSLSNSDSFEQISFVNGICTPKGGKHVDLVSKMLTSSLKKHINKKTKRDVNETYIKNYLRIFIDTLIINPSFDSQTKERLITTASKFGSKPEISEKFIKQILDKTNILDRVVQFSEFKLNKQNKKTDGQKKNKIRDIPKLDDANWAGTRKSDQCILILTEGDSAKSMAVSGLSVVGRDIYGAFPLKGKVMNVRDASIDQIMKNSEITNMKKILGLVNSKIYTDTKSLRYGKIMIMTDQDHDGSHIKGLVMNVFHHMWPSLLELGYITSMITPIVKVSLKKKIKSFYTLTEYQDWINKTKDSKSWKTKYYKGLGTSSASEAREYFSNMKLNNYIYDKETDEKMSLAFSKDKSNLRKEWLYNFDENNILDHKKTEISIPDFINKELIHFSNSDTLRSIGSLYDGLKPSQRKILYSCFKRKLYTEIRVAQLAGYVSENAAYHHGEASLQGAIIGMAQDYVGSNNINLLMPNGQFGTRIMGGHDSASPRYIHTELNKIVDLIYPSLDFKLLEYNDDDGILVEPKYYVPIIPMVLVNGMNGIGTGFSTSIPQHDPIDIIKNMKRKIRCEKYGNISPYYRNFIGKIVKIDKKNYLSKGKYEIIDECSLRITELPIGKWTDDYKKFLDSLIPDTSKKKSLENENHKKKSQPKKTIIDYVNNSSDKDIDFLITFEKGFLNSLQWDEDENIDGIEKFFKLTTSKGLSYNNIHLYNDKNQIHKYDNVYDIFDEFYKIRYELYVKRKEYLLSELNNSLLILNSKMRFITDVMNDKIKIYKRKRVDIIKDLLNEKYLMVLDGRTLEFNNDKKAEELKYYDYLIKMSIYLFTEDEIEKLSNKINTLSEEYNNLDKLTIEEIWLDELDKLLNILD